MYEVNILSLVWSVPLIVAYWKDVIGESGKAAAAAAV